MTTCPNLECSIENIVKPYKIVYVKYLDSFDPNTKIDLENQKYNELISKIDDENINIKNYNLFELEDGFELNCYIFIGKNNEEIRDILDTIENTRIINEDDIEVINNYFKYNCQEEWGDLSEDKYTNIKFLDIVIKNDDNIFTIKNAIFKFIGDIENENFINQNQLLTCNLNDQYFNLSDKILPTNLLHNKMQNLYKRIVKRKGGFTFHNLYQELESIGINTRDEDFQTKYEEIYQNIDITSFDDFLNNFQIQSFLNDFIIHPILNHKYYSYLRTNIYISNSIVNYFSSDYFGYENLINLPHIKLDEVNENKVLYRFGNIENNTIYLYNFENIHKYFITKNMLDLSIKDDNNKYFNGFIKKYFPKINENNYTDYINNEILLKKNIVDSLKFNEIIINNSTSIHKLIENSDNLLKEDISITKSNLLTLRFEHNLNILDAQSNLDLLSIFNELLLSYDIPFVKLKDPITREMIYKIFKPITSIEYQNYDPIVKNNTLQDWINFIGAEYNDGNLTNIKGNIKNLQYKLRLFDLKKSNKIIEGSIYKINISNNSFDILIDDTKTIKANITKQFLIQCKDRDSDEWDIIEDDSILKALKPGDNVKFLDFETYYANVEITKSGKIIFDTVYKLVQNVNIELIIKQLISRFNYFIELFKNLDFLKSISDIILPISVNLLDFNTDFFNTSFDDLGLCTEIKIPNNIDLDYDNIRKLSSLYWPFITILDNIFFNGETIEYYDEDRSKWVEGNIIKINTTLPTTYNITVNSANRKSTKVYNDVLARRLRKKGQKEYRKFIDFKYKRISNFNKLPPIKLLIHKKHYQSMSVADIIKSVIDVFSISIVDAKKIVSDTLTNELSSNRKLETNIGINIKINYLDYDEIDTHKVYKVYIEGISDIIQIKKINKFLVSFFKLYSENFKNNLSILDTEYSEIKEKYLNMDAELIEDEDIEIHNKDIERPVDDFVPDEDDWFNSDSEDEDSADILSPKQVEDIKSPQMLKKEDKKSEILDIDLVQKKRRQNVSYILQKLYEHDNELFGWKTTAKNKSYTKVCQEAKRHPKVITDDEKRYIDEQFPGSYGKPGDIDCDFTKDTNITGRVKCKAIKWGSTKQNGNWYICPKIWDIKDNIPLRISDLQFDQPFTPHEDNWRMHFDPDDAEWNGKDILEFNPKYNGRGPINSSGNNKFLYPNNRQSLWFQPIYETERYNYPGFLGKGKHPNGIPVPCCFRGYSKHVQDYFGNSKSPGAYENEYIQGYNKSLGWKPYRIGLLHPKLYKYFGINPEECTTGELNYRANCFLRRGIKQSHNSFLSLIANFKNDMTEEQLIKKILENITYDEFLTLNKGNIEIQFRNNTKNLFSSFQNYLEYIISDKDKDYIYFWDYLTRPHKWLFPNGISLILIDTVINNGREDFEIVCPYFFNSKINNSTKIAIAIKNGNIYEPVYFYFNSQKISSSEKILPNPLRLYPLKYRSGSVLSSNLNKISDLHETFIKELCILKNKSLDNHVYDNVVNTNNKILSDALLKPQISFIYAITEIDKNIASKKLDMGFKPIKVIYDNYNKAIGILLNNLVHVPVKPEFIEKYIDFKRVSRIINIMDGGLNPYDVHNGIYLIKGDKMITKLEELSKIIPSLNVNIIRKINSITDSKFVIGLETETASIIPVKKTPTNNKLLVDLIKSSNNIDADKKLFEYSEFYNKKFFKSIYSFDKTKLYLEDINSTYSTKNYNIQKLYVPNKDDVVKGIITNNELLISIENINLKDIDSDYNSLPIVNKFMITNYEDSINDYFRLWKYSNTDLHVKPIRNIMSLDKNIIGYVLENGTTLMLNEREIFNINDKNNNDYKINIIPNIEFDSMIDEIKPQLYESEFIDKRVEYIKKLKYKKNTYEKFKSTFSLFLQMPENFKIKNYLMNELNYLGKTISKKRRETKIIFERIFNIIADDTSIVQDDFIQIIKMPNNKLCINNIDSCVDNLYCSLKKLTKQNYNEIDIFKRIYKFTEDDKILLNDQNKLRSHLIKIKSQLDAPISDSNEVNKDIYIEQLLRKSEQPIKDRIDKILEILNIMETNIETGKYNFCKMKINTIIRKGDGKILKKNNLFYIFLNRFIEEMIRNKFKRIQILKNIKNSLSNSKYIVNKPFEVLFSENDFNISNINDLYYNVLRQYYRNIDIYEYKNPEKSSIILNFNTDLEPLDISKPLPCIIDERYDNIPYIVIKSKDNLVKNKNLSKVSKKVVLSLSEYQNIKKYLDMINTELDECVIKSNFVCTYKILTDKVSL